MASSNMAGVMEKELIFLEMAASILASSREENIMDTASILVPMGVDMKENFRMESLKEKVRGSLKTNIVLEINVSSVSHALRRNIEI
jgi:hypothetical protein